MANIYEVTHEKLHELLEKARSEDGATVVVPELQRPYVWKPDQVILLVDSLIRGWPFGTLLMWKVGHDELSQIPHRPFWRTIDRTENSDGTTAIRQNPPGDFRMVLDGQQRVQSLLLALGGDAWGFKLEDRDWFEALEGRRPRGRAPRYKHWSKACLCFDLDAFLEEYRNGSGLLSVEFRNVLKWAIMDSADGQSTWAKPDNYAEPLDKGFEAPHNSRLVRLSRLWLAAETNPNLKEKEFRNIVGQFLEDQRVLPEKIKELLEPLGEFMTTLRDVKLSNVTTLELCQFNEGLWEREEYNDAIVNIFTRLNTAGRTLTREEITFAWLKSNWDATSTDGKSAADCFEELRDELKSSGLDIGMDDVVNAVSFIWSVRFNKEGKLLSNNDLLKGPVIRPMAKDLSGSWSAVKDSIVEVAELVQNREIAHGTAGQFASVNALAVLWAWYALHNLWSGYHLTAVQQDDFDKKCRGTLEKYVDRWLLCSTWSGRWSGSSNTAVSKYARDLNADWSNINESTSYDEVHGVLQLRLHTLVSELEQDASNYVNTVSADSRERVSVYRNVLWAWHRLDANRWSRSKIPLRTGRRTKTALEVDHTVSYAFWQEVVGNQGLPKDCHDEEEALGIANLLGNCALLEKTFNISKGKQTLASFMEQVTEIREENPKLRVWAEALGIADALLAPDEHTLDEIASAIKTRDTAIREEVTGFVKGTKERQDL